MFKIMDDDDDYSSASSERALSHQKTNSRIHYSRAERAV
jgi:hypothetical protein